MDLEEIEALIVKTLKELFDNLNDVSEFLVLDSVLLGKNSVIDSLSLVNLIVDLEEEISDRLGVSISLTDDEAVFAEPSPYGSARSLAAYIAQLVN